MEYFAWNMQEFYFIYIFIKLPVLSYAIYEIFSIYNSCSGIVAGGSQYPYHSLSLCYEKDII